MADMSVKPGTADHGVPFSFMYIMRNDKPKKVAINIIIRQKSKLDYSGLFRTLTTLYIIAM